MLAAQCNKLSSKSPPPLADAAVGKGFHPWKKSPGLCPPNSVAGVLPTCPTSVGGNGVMTNPMTHSSLLSAAQKSLSSSVCVTSSNHNAYSRTPVSSSCGATPTYGADLYFHGSSGGNPCGDQSPVGSVGVYSRVPYVSMEKVNCNSLVNYIIDIYRHFIMYQRTINNYYPRCLGFLALQCNVWGTCRNQA